MKRSGTQNNMFLRYGSNNIQKHQNPQKRKIHVQCEKIWNTARQAVTVEHVGLWSDLLEPCVSGGQIVKDGHELGFCLCIVYVDDIPTDGNSEWHPEKIAYPGKMPESSRNFV